MAARPVVDGIERRASGRLTVLRVDMQSPAGAALSRELRVTFTPTFLFYDAEGQERFRRVGQISFGDVEPFLGP
jgi:hypothetical protein